MVKHNTAQMQGGGFNILSEASVTLSSGAHLDISDNKALMAEGGGMYINAHCK